MKTHAHIDVQFGQLIVAAFDEAARHSLNPEEVAFLATAAVTSILRHARSRLLIASSSPTTRRPTVAAC